MSQNFGPLHEPVVLRTVVFLSHWHYFDYRDNRRYSSRVSESTAQSHRIRNTPVTSSDLQERRQYAPVSLNFQARSHFSRLFHASLGPYCISSPLEFKTVFTGSIITKTGSWRVHPSSRDRRSGLQNRSP